MDVKRLDAQIVFCFCFLSLPKKRSINSIQGMFVPYIPQMWFDLEDSN